MTAWRASRGSRHFIIVTLRSIPSHGISASSSLHVLSRRATPPTPPNGRGVALLFDLVFWYTQNPGTHNVQRRAEKHGFNTIQAILPYWLTSRACVNQDISSCPTFVCPRSTLNCCLGFAKFLHRVVGVRPVGWFDSLFVRPRSKRGRFRRGCGNQRFSGCRWGRVYRSGAGARHHGTIGIDQPQTYRHISTFPTALLIVGTDRFPLHSNHLFLIPHRKLDTSCANEAHSCRENSCFPPEPLSGLSLHDKWL